MVKGNNVLKCPHCGKGISLKCERCGYEWIPRSNTLPKVCPNRKCKSPYWDRERTRKFKKNDNKR
jgi:predicted amidophosphoribosyltransferase